MYIKNAYTTNDPYTYVQMFMDTYMYRYMHMKVSVDIKMYMYMFICIYRYANIFRCLCMYIYIYVYIHVYIYIYIFKYIHMYIYILCSYRLSGPSDPFLRCACVRRTDVCQQTQQSYIFAGLCLESKTTSKPTF